MIKYLNLENAYDFRKIEKKVNSTFLFYRKLLSVTRLIDEVNFKFLVNFYQKDLKKMIS